MCSDIYVTVPEKYAGKVVGYSKTGQSGRGGKSGIPGKGGKNGWDEAQENSGVILPEAPNGTPGHDGVSPKPLPAACMYINHILQQKYTV